MIRIGEEKKNREDQLFVVSLLWYASKGLKNFLTIGGTSKWQDCLWDIEVPPLEVSRQKVDGHRSVKPQVEHLHGVGVDQMTWRMSI